MFNISILKEKILKSENKFLFSYIIFFVILFLSKFIFAYDEEKVIILCLISFVIIFYENTSKIIYNVLNEKSLSLENDFLNLYKDKLFIMKKLRIYWRLFLDLEELIVEFFVWLKKQFKSLILLKKNKRIYIVQHFIKDKIKLLLYKVFLIKKTLNLIYVKNLKFYFYLMNKNKTLSFSKTINSLKDLNKNIKYKHWIINKLNLKIKFIKNNNYFSYLFLDF